MTMIKAGLLVFASALVAGALTTDASADERRRGNNVASGHGFETIDRGNQRRRAYYAREHCYRGFYNAEHCPNPRSHLRYGPYPRDFAFGQGMHIMR